MESLHSLENSLLRLDSGFGGSKVYGCDWCSSWRPRAGVDESELCAMRKSGASRPAIATKLGVGLGTVHRIAQPRSKNVCGDFSNGSPKVLYT